MVEGRYSTALVSVLGWDFESCGSVVRTNLKFGHLKKRFGRFPSAVGLRIGYLHTEMVLRASVLTHCDEP